MNEELEQLLPSWREAIDSVVMLVLTVVAVFALQSSYGGGAFLAIGIVGALFGALVAHLCYAVRLPLTLTVVVALVLYVLVCPPLAISHHALAGIVPTPTSVLESLTSAVTGWKELITTAPPVGSTGDLMVLPLAGGMASAFASTTMARRLRFAPLAVLPPIGLLGLGIAVGTQDAVSVMLHGAVFGVMVLGWLAWREELRRPLLEGAGVHRRQIATGLAVLAVAGSAGFFVSPQLPGAEASRRDIWRQTVTPPFDPRQYPSPLSGYREYVKLDRDAAGEQVDAEVMFTVQGLPEGVPVRLATMDSWDGLVWQVSGGDPENPSLTDSGSFERVGASLTPDYDGEMAEVTITIGKYSDVWIPNVGEVVSLRFRGSAGGVERDRELANSFRYNRATDTAATVRRLREGDRYEMTVYLPTAIEEMSGQIIDPDVPRLGQAAPLPLVSQVFVTPELLAIDDTGERLDQVRGLMMRTGAYSDGDVGGDQVRARAGHSAFRLSEFIQDFPDRPFIGNAEQYASTYALLFRQLGNLPTRVVMGFFPPEASLDRAVAVVSTDVEAWVEVPVRDVGWVGIEPTPDRDQQPSLTSSPQQPEPDYRTQNPPPPPLLDPEFDQPARASGDAEGDDDGDDDTDDGASNPLLSRRALMWAGIAVSPILLVEALVGAILLVKHLRRRRRRSQGDAHQRIANGWLEVTDLAVDMGRPVPNLTTRREAASFVGGDTMVLAERTDAAVWGGGDLTDTEVDAYWNDLTTTLESMRNELGVVDRFKTNVSLRSLRRRQVSPGATRP